MSDELRRILDMVAGGKITAEEGERLISALNARSGEEAADAPKPKPRFLKVQGRGHGKDGRDEGFSLRVPLGLIRAGMKMRALVPEGKREEVSRKLREKGIEADIFDMSEDQVDGLIEGLGEIELEAGDGEATVSIRVE